MKKTIRSIFRGNIFISEKCGSDNEEISRLMKEICKAYDDLLTKIGKDKEDALEE